MTRQELIYRLKNARTFREAGVTLADVLNVFLEDEATQEPPTKEQADVVAELNRQIEAQRETIKKLRAENKKMRGQIGK